MADKKTHRYRLMLDLDDPVERALSELLDALKPYNNGRSVFQRRALIRYMANLLHSDISDMDNVEEAQLAVQAQMLLKDRALELKLRPDPAVPSVDQSSEPLSSAVSAPEHGERPGRPGEVAPQEPNPSTHKVSQTQPPTPSQTAENQATSRPQQHTADPGSNAAPAKRPASPLKRSLAGIM